MPQPPQSQRNSEGFFIREHHGRQAEPRPQTVEATHPAHRFHRHRQILKPRNITLHGPQIDLQTRGQFAAADMIASLQNLQNSQHAHDGVVHKFIVSWNYVSPCRESPLKFV